MIRKFQNPSGKLTYEEALRQAGERVENQMKPSIQAKGVNNSDSRFKFKEKGTKRQFKKEAERERYMTQQSPTSEIVHLSKEESDYVNWKKLSSEQKQQRRNNIAKAYLNSGPNITNLWNAFQAYIGNKDPENPHLNTGEPSILPGIATPQQVQQSAKLMETINNYWKNLGKLKIRLGGNGKYASGILTKPGTAPSTFNGQNIKYITSPKGGNVTHKFYTDQGSEYILTKDGFARRIKTPHNNTKGVDAGLHDWNKGKTYFLDTKDANDFAGQFTLIKEKYPNVAVATGKDGKMYFMNTDTNKLILTEEVFPNAVREGILPKGYYNVPYSQEPKLGYSIFEFGTNGPTGKINWYHPGSSVAFIEGLKQGGKMIYKFKKGNKIHIKKANRGKFTDYCGGKVTNECIQRGKNSSDPAVRKRATFAANARKWNHKKGGVIVAGDGIKLGNIFSKAQGFLNSDTGRLVIDGIGKLYSGIKQSNNQRKQEEQLLKDYNYISKQINTQDVINKTNQQFQELQQQDPNIHVSEIDWRNLYGKNEGIAKQQAQANARNYLVNARQQMMLQNSQSSGGGLDFSGLINAGAQLLSGNKNKTNTGTTNTTTTNTQIPSTATPTYFSSGFDWSKPTLTSAIKFST